MASEISSSSTSKKQQQQQRKQRRPRPQKILKTEVKLCGRYLLEDGDEFDLETVRRLVHRATVEQRLHLHTQLRLTSAGLQLGKDGVLSSMPAEEFEYPRVLGLLAFTDDTKTLALCLQSVAQRRRGVTVLQFKDSQALNVVVNVIDRHRRLEPADPSEANAGNWLLQQQRQEQQEELQQQEQQERHQQQHVYDDDEGIETRAVFNSEYAVIERQQQEQEQQQQQVQVQVQVNGGSSSGGGSGGRGRGDRGEIESEILNYDDVSGPRQQRRAEPPVQLRRQQQQQQQQQQHFSSTSSSLSPTSPSAKVVTSFSSGYSGALNVNVDSGRAADQQYRTSTVIYRDTSDAQHRVTYLPPQQQQVVQVQQQPQVVHLQQQQQQQPQQQQVMRLVPVGSARRQQRQTRYFTLQPLSPRESALFTVAK